MASLTAKKIGGRTYYYLRECQRVDGRPKIVWQKYLGTAAEVAAALEKHPSALEPLPEAAVFEFGAVTAVYDLSRRLELVKTIDHRVPKRANGGPSVGTYLMLAALNRAVAPRSKRKLAGWYKQTSLPRYLKIRPSQLTSQRFWDNMDRVSEAALIDIERELTERVVQRYEVDRSSLFYDATNFFTFIDSFNVRPSLAQRGKSKEGRANLRILGLALLVTRDHHIPLFHHLYPGNQPDAPTFRSVLGELVARYRLFAQGVEDITLVFDKGNNAEDIIESVDKSPYHFVGSLVPTQHEDLLAIAWSKYRQLDPELFPDGVYAHRTEKEVYGRRFPVLMTYNENLFVAQTRTLDREIAKRQGKLRAYQQSLERWRRGKGRGKRPTVKSAEKGVARILQGRHMKDLFRVEIQAESRGKTKGLPKLRYRFDGAAYRRLQRTLLGKTILFTDQEEWSDEQMVLAYRGQHFVEGAFRQMKDVRYLSFRPSFHWTDQKLRVHAFCCVAALLLCSLLRLELLRKGIKLTIPSMLHRLGSIQEVHVLTSSGRGRPRTHRVRSKLDSLAQRLFDAVGLDRYLKA
ncbi:MAG: IS1634 family transposase [Acidobacteriota bacterium]